MTPTALITGVAGQDGALLARRLMSEGYRVVGTTQPGVPTILRPYLDGVVLEEHDVRDADGFSRLLDTHEPAEVYNLAGFTSVGASWDNRDLVMDVNAVAVDNMLRSLVRRDGVKFFQASSSEVFGLDAANPQDESTAHDPRSPYAESKSLAHTATVRARDEDGLFACVGVLYNHESPLRGMQFVTRKIVRAAVEIAEGRRRSVSLGNLAVSRDWGSAREYVVAMHLALTYDVADDYIIATGVAHTLRELLELAFASAGLGDPWQYVDQDQALIRPADAGGLIGDSSKAGSQLGWKPSVRFDQVVDEMVQVDFRRVKSGVEESADYLVP